MQEIEKARIYFKLMPNEVFDLWLADRVRTNGWPPQGIEWQGFLYDHTPEIWKSLNWQKRETDIRYENLKKESQDLVDLLIDANINGNSNILTGYLPDTKERFSSIMRYTLLNKKLPEPLILLYNNGIYTLIDGNHRMSVHTALRQTKETEIFAPKSVLAWVAELP